MFDLVPIIHYCEMFRKIESDDRLKGKVKLIGISVGSRLPVVYQRR